MALVFNGSNNTIGGLAVGGIPDNTIDNGCLADDAVGIADLSATGTASATTFLRGDNSWATAGDANPTGTGLFRAHVSSAISIANNSWADPVIWQTEDYDLEGWYNTTTGKYTPQVAGYYKFEVGLMMSNFGSTWAEIWVRHQKNGSDYAEFANNSPQGGAYEGGHSSSIVLLNGSSDYWTCRVLNQNGDGGSDNILASTNYNWVNGYLLKAT